MTRSITIGYRNQDNEPEISIPVQAPYFLLGTQRTSMQFWSIPRLKEIGVMRLTELGVSDPVGFFGWEMMSELDLEIGLLQKHLPTIEFYPELKSQWLSHLVYCYFLLIQTAPRESFPVFTIG